MQICSFQVVSDIDLKKKNLDLSATMFFSLSYLFRNGLKTSGFMSQFDSFAVGDVWDESGGWDVNCRDKQLNVQMEIASLFFGCRVHKVLVLMDMASCSLPLFTISYGGRAGEKRLAIDAPELHGDHTDRTCGPPPNPP